MSGQTIVNAMNWSIVVGFALWVGLYIAEQCYEARQRRLAERRATRERHKP